jgi:hypothetical protein
MKIICLAAVLFFFASSAKSLTADDFLLESQEYLNCTDQTVLLGIYFLEESGQKSAARDLFRFYFEHGVCGTKEVAWSIIDNWRAMTANEDTKTYVWLKTAYGETRYFFWPLLSAEWLNR